MSLGVFHGTVQENGKIDFESPRAFIQHVGAMKGKRVDITVEIHRARRSEGQHKLLRAVIRAAADELGWEFDEFWEVMKHRFLLTERNGMQYVRSTSSLNTKEMSELYDNVLRWLAMEFHFTFYSRQDVAELKAAGMQHYLPAAASAT